MHRKVLHLLLEPIFKKCAEDFYDRMKIATDSNVYTFSELLKNADPKKGISVKEIANEMGVTSTAVSKGYRVEFNEFFRAYCSEKEYPLMQVFFNPNTKNMKHHFSIGSTKKNVSGEITENKYEEIKPKIKYAYQDLKIQPPISISSSEDASQLTPKPPVNIWDLPGDYFEFEVQEDRVEDIDGSCDYLYSSDVTTFIAAATFIERLSNGAVDPKAARLFASITHAFCNGATLVLPLPAKEQGDIPLYSLWQNNAASVSIEAPKLSRKGITNVGSDIEQHFIKSVEDDGGSFATWIASQFSDEVVKEHEKRTEIAEIAQDYGNMARKLIEDGKMTDFLDALALSKRNNELNIPLLYEEVLNEHKLNHNEWCLAYLLSVCIRAVPYSTILHKKFGERVVYQYHWIRNPVGQTYTCNDGEVAQEKVNHYNWGRLLEKIFGSDNPLKEDRSLERVCGVLEIIRDEFPVKSLGCDFSQLSKPRDYNVIKLTDEEDIILQVLYMAGVKLKEKLSSRPIEDIGYFLGWNDNFVRNAVKPISFTISQDMIEDSKGEEYDKVGVRINRENIWDHVEDPGIRG